MSRSGLSDGTFIDVDVDGADRATTPSCASKLEEVCPVDIFRATDGRDRDRAPENLDECVLCELCLDAAPPGTVVDQEALRRHRAQALAVRQTAGP